MACGADSPRVWPVKRHYPLFLATLLLSTLARAQSPAPAGEQPPVSSTPAAPAEAPPVPPLQPDGTHGPVSTPETAPAKTPTPAKPDKEALGLSTVAVLA